MSQFVGQVTKQLEEKGKEINAYREEHNIRIRGQDDRKEEEKPEAKSSGSGGVLVANSS